MSWTKIYWDCKHTGKTLPHVLFEDPDWFFFMIEKHKFEDKGPILGEARKLDQRARNIRIPKNEDGTLVAEYTKHPSDYSFGCLDLVFRVQDSHSRLDRSDVIDMSYPHRLKNFDKLGNRQFLAELKYILYGDAKYRMTKKRCEIFFEADANFVIGRTKE